MYEYLLPLGSVVVLKEGKKPLMIFGVIQTDPENMNVEYDYVSVPYPEGNLGPKTQFLFNHDAIDKILFRGYEDEMRTEFMEIMEKVAKEQKQENNQE